MRCPNCKKDIYVPKRFQMHASAIWIFLGEHFGYPKCCISYFTNMMNIEECIKYGKKGFVPCPRCCERIKKGEKIENLIKNRRCVKIY